MTDHDVLAVSASDAAVEAAVKDWAERLVAQARVEGVELTGEGGLLTGLVGQVLRTGLGVEMAERLGCGSGRPAERAPNSGRRCSPS